MLRNSSVNSKAHYILQSVFGFKSFLPNQEQIVQAIVSRQETPEAKPLVDETFFIPPPPPALSRGDTVMETAVLLDKGLGIGEVATRRGLKPTTIITHIERLLENGHPVDIAPLIDTANLEPSLAVLRQSESAAIGPVVEQFEGRITYEDARLARAWLAASARREG